MKFAVNYSPAAAELFSKGLITVDLFKCPDWPDVIGKAQDLGAAYTHFPLKAGHPDRIDVDLDAVGKMLTRTSTPHVNTHLDPQLDREAGPLTTEEEAFACTLAHVSALVDRFGADRVVVENVPYWKDPSLHARLAANPSFITRVVEETGCGLLLDLSHARIAARGLGLDERAYIRALPVDRLRELHVTGLATVEGWLRDHMPMSEEDWSAFGWAMEQIRNGYWSTPRLVAYEYGGIGPRFEWRTDREAIADQVPYLYGMVNARPPRVHLRDRAQAGSPRAAGTPLTTPQPA